MVLNWEKATDKQLWNILANDWDVPANHLEGLVTEALNRHLFDHLIKHLINKMFDRWDNERRYHFYDLYSLGYIGIVIAMKNYQDGKGSFKTFCYMNIQSEFNHHIQKGNREKRKVYESVVSLDIQKFEENEESFLDSLIDETQDPEKVVLHKLFWEEEFNKVTDLEKDILILFSNGYTMNEIAKLKGYNGASFISRKFHSGIKKINPNAEKMNVKYSGLMTRTKGA